MNMITHDLNTDLTEVCHIVKSQLGIKLTKAKERHAKAMGFNSYNHLNSEVKKGIIEVNSSHYKQAMFQELIANNHQCSYFRVEVLSGILSEHNKKKSKPKLKLPETHYELFSKGIPALPYAISKDIGLASSTNLDVPVRDMKELLFAGLDMSLSGVLMYLQAITEEPYQNIVLERGIEGVSHEQFALDMVTSNEPVPKDRMHHYNWMYIFPFNVINGSGMRYHYDDALVGSYTQEILAKPVADIKIPGGGVMLTFTDQGMIDLAYSISGGERVLGGVLTVYVIYRKMLERGNITFFVCHCKGDVNHLGLKREVATFSDWNVEQSIATDWVKVNSMGKEEADSLQGDDQAFITRGLPFYSKIFSAIQDVDSAKAQDLTL